MKKWLLLLYFCSVFHKTYGNGQDYIDIINRISTKFSKQMRNENGMYLFGKGGSMMFDIREVTLSYNAIKNPTLQEARSLFVEASERYLFMVNGDQSVRPFLRNYPFKIDNFDFSISFQNENHEYSKHVAFMFYSSRRGVIIYDGYDFENKRLFTLFEEPYEEAKRIVMESKRPAGSVVVAKDVSQK